MAWVRDTKELKALKVRAKSDAEKRGHLFDRYVRMDHYRWMGECLRCGKVMFISISPNDPEIAGEMSERACKKRIGGEK